MPWERHWSEALSFGCCRGRWLFGEQLTVQSLVGVPPLPPVAGLSVLFTNTGLQPGREARVPL